MPDEYDVGERVGVTIADGRVDAVGDGWLTVAVGDGRVVVPVGCEQVRLGRVAPAAGEPRPGEIWTDRIGGLWWATQEGKAVYLVGAEPGVQHDGSRSRMHWRDVHKGPVGPIRRLWTGETAPAGPATDGGPDEAPLYVHRLIDAFLFRTPLDFGRHEVPADVQRRLAAAVSAGDLGAVKAAAEQSDEYDHTLTKRAGGWWVDCPETCTESPDCAVWRRAREQGAAETIAQLPMGQYEVGINDLRDRLLIGDRVGPADQI